MKLEEKGFKLIKTFEGCKLESYKCSAGVWTIGFGSTFYEDGSPVKEGEEITQERAEELFQRTLVSYVNCVNKFVKSKISQNQFDAMVSLTYNIGCGNFKKSSVLSKVNKNAKDPSIADSFLLWNKAKGKVIKGLQRRREAEAELYFTVN
jgi:lysozyme